jgi:outer membrane protein TolC
VEQQFKVGVVETVDVLVARVEAATASQVALDGWLKLQQAIGALEEAMQSPLEVKPALLESPLAKAKENSK